MKKMIIEMVLATVGNEYLYFGDALKIKKSPHSPVITIWAVCVSPDQEIYLMDSDQEWHKLEETDMDYNLVIASLWARMKVITKKVA